jgi:tRNA threonylcarbamoyladenosine biosynthesis protein TsaE
MTAALEFITASAEETRRLGERIGRLLNPGDVLLLSGELGAGKTTFVQGLARGLGFEGSASSKSFVLMGEYRGHITLYHADLYRLDDPREVQELAIDEVSADGVLAVEWPERAPQVLPDEHLRLNFQITGEESRRITLSAHGERAQEIIRRLAAEESQ